MEKQTKARLLLNFDEANVLRQVDSLYEELDKHVRKKLRELWYARFMEVMALLIDSGFNKKAPDEIYELLEMHLAGLLDEPSDVTHYTYSHEVLRKRDRAKEAILSVPTKAQKQIELGKHLRYYLQQVRWYSDFTSQDAEVSAYAEANVKKVQRHEMDDNRVCAVCRAADGEIYDIDNIPPLPHPACRRWFTAIK